LREEACEAAVVGREDRKVCGLAPGWLGSAVVEGGICSDTACVLVAAGWSAAGGG
jgi:hypothetical protein